MVVLRYVVLLIVTISGCVCYDNVLRRESIAYAISTLGSNNINSSQCMKQLDHLANATDRREVWALKLLDSSGGPTSGFLWGNNFWLGKQTECVYATNRRPLILNREKDRHNANATEEFYPPYAVNYFVAYLRHNFSLQWRVRLSNEDIVSLGLCLPDICTSEELSPLLEKYFDERTLMIHDLYKVDFKLDYVKDMREDYSWLLSPSFIIMTLILLFTITISTIATAYDVTVYQPHLKLKKLEPVTGSNNNIKMGSLLEHKINGQNDYQPSVINRNEHPLPNPELHLVKSTYEPALWNKILLSFSLYTNIKIILDTSISADSVPAVHGLRFGGMMWIIMVHTVFYMADYADNRPYAWIMGEGMAVQVISNSTLSVDTFFFMSGFLVAYLFYKGKRGKIEKRPVNFKTKWIEFVMMTVRRYLRLTPTYMVALVIIMVNYNWYAQVSSYHMSERVDEICAKNWWKNLLYINNLFSREEMCLSWSWYLSNDMQFFVIGAFLMILSTVYFTIALLILVALILLSVFTTGYISYAHSYVPTMDEQFNMLNVLYDPPWTRIGPYLVGVVTGYVVVKMNGKLNLKKRTITILWIVMPLVNLSVLLGLYNREISVLTSAVYAGLSRTVWGIGLAWTLIACCTNNGGIVNKILSFKGFVPLSRMTYCAYLINPWIINSVYLDSEYSKHAEFISFNTYYMGFLMISYFCAFVMSVLFESPAVLLMRIVVGAREQKNKIVDNPS